MATSFEKLLDENLSTVIMKQGSLVTGIVIDILDNHVVVHVGLKSEAVVPISEFYNESGELELEIGDEVQLTLEAIEDGHGNTRVSREKAIKQEVWKRIEDCLEQDSILKGLNKCHDNDIVILSDVDEIPDLKKLNLFDKNKYAVFSQKMFMWI